MGEGRLWWGFDFGFAFQLTIEIELDAFGVPIAGDVMPGVVVPIGDA